MLSRRSLGLDPALERRGTRAAWVAAARVLAVPFALFEVAVERGNYPPGDEGRAWAIVAVLAVGAAALAAARGRAWAPAAGVAFDLAIVSAFVALYSFEAGTTVRQLVVLPALEAAFVFGTRAGGALALAGLPALAFFEWRQAHRLDLHPFDAGHVLGPAGIALLVAVVTGALLSRLTRLRTPAGGRRDT